MLFILGLIVVFGSVLGGFSIHGDLRILWQPVEYVIIVGAGFGAFLITNPSYVIKQGLSSLKYLFKGKPYKKSDYMQLLQLLFDTLKIMKLKGLLTIEAHIDNPKESDIFQKYPVILANHHITDFICNNIRLMTLGVENQYIMSDAMEQEIDIHHNEAHAASHALTLFGDSLPALGIVAAVLGVITTMGSISEPPEVLGALIGAALVGTFSGVLLSYGVFSPIGAFVGQYGEAETAFYNVIKIAIISHLQGNAPSVSIEIARKNIPHYVRPSFNEVDAAINS